MSLHVGRTAAAPSRAGGAREALGSGGLWALTAVLLGLVAIVLPGLGSDPWPFKPGDVDPRGVCVGEERIEARNRAGGIA